MSAKEVIDELREYLDSLKEFTIGNIIQKAEIKNKLTELERKYCKEEKKGCYACTECGHPHKLEDLIYFEGNGKIADEL
jgi:hypothetical protein